MLPGPTIIRECTACGSAFLQPTISSGNTFGATIWTDGKMDAPMLPDSPWLVRCPRCGICLWVDEQPERGRLERGISSCSGLRLRRFRLPRTRDYLKVLRGGSLCRDKEKYIRVRLWWSWNDARRYRLRIPRLWVSAAERENLLRLAELMSEEDPSELLGKAEIMRELGQFEEARRLISRAPSDRPSEVAQFLAELVEQEDRALRVFPRTEYESP